MSALIEYLGLSGQPAEVQATFSIVFFVILMIFFLDILKIVFYNHRR